MRRHLPPLGSLKAFEAVARLGSVTKAADAMGRTHGAVSRQLRQLQDALGAPLFDKDGVGIRLNADGRAFLQDVTPALDQLEAAFQALSQATAHPAHGHHRRQPVFRHALARAAAAQLLRPAS